MASYLSKYHTLTSSLPLKSLDNAKFSSSLFPSHINLSSNNTCAYLFNNNNKTTPLLCSNPRFVTIIAMAPPLKGGKTKKVVGLIKLALEAGKATFTLPMGPALGSKGVNIMAFCKDYNARTADKAGYVIPVEIIVYDDKSFTFVLKTTHASILLFEVAACGQICESLNSGPSHVIDITREDVDVVIVVEGDETHHELHLEAGHLGIVLRGIQDAVASMNQEDKKVVHLLFELNDECDTNTTIENNRIEGIVQNGGEISPNWSFITVSG